MFRGRRFGLPESRRGRFPPDLLDALTAEGLRYREEGLRSTHIQRDVRGPGRFDHASYEREWFGPVGAVAVSDRRLVVWLHQHPFVTVGLSGPWPPGIGVTADHRGLTVVVDAARYRPGLRSGTIELRLRTGRAAEIVSLLRRGVVLEPLRSELIAEGLVLLEEELAGTVDDGVGGHLGPAPTAVAVSAKRLVVWHDRGRYTHVPLVEGRPTGIDVTLLRPGVVAFGFDPAAFRDVPSGRGEVLVMTSRAAEIVALLT